MEQHAVSCLERMVYLMTGETRYMHSLANSLRTQAVSAPAGDGTAERQGYVFYTSIGRKGGEQTKARLGRAHYERIGRLGGMKSGKSTTSSPTGALP